MACYIFAHFRKKNTVDLFYLKCFWSAGTDHSTGFITVACSPGKANLVPNTLSICWDV